MDREDGCTQQIYDAAVICSNLFELCVNSSAALSSNHDFATELRGRFNLWAAYVGAFAAPKASLDARLIAHAGVRDMVVDLLVMIQANMKHVLESSNDTKPASEHMSSEDSSLLPGLNAVETALGRLHSLAIAIRRSAIRSHKQKLNLDAPEADESLVYLDLVRRRFKHARESLVDQLGRSIHFRGRSMYYQQRHNRKIAEKRSDKEAVIQSNIEEIVEDAQPETSTTIDIPQQSPNAHALMSETNASVLDKQDLLTRLRNARPSYSIVSKGSSIQESQDNRFDYPKMPRAKDNSSGVLCPLCSEPLDLLTLTLKTWQDHVDRDIEPYVCISEECKEPLQFFVHHQDWKEHMQRTHTLDWPQIVHTTMWYCDLDHSHEEFDRKDNFLEHLSTKHTLTRPQILARTRRNKLLPTREPFICPLCDDRPEDVALHISEKPYGLLFTHIAQHLKALAFYSLTYLDFDGASSEESPVVDGQIDGVDISNASRRSSVVSSFGEIPVNETLESGGMRVVCAEVFADGGKRMYEHYFQEPPESEDLPWNHIPRQIYPEYDKTLEAFAAAMNGRPGTASLSLTEKILSQYVESHFDSKVMPFLPAGRIDRLVTRGAIIKECQEEGNAAISSHLVDFVLVRARIVFALTVLCGLKGANLVSAVVSFVEANFTDSSLPIKDGEEYHFFRDRSIWPRFIIQYFCQQQWTFLAPVFSRQHFKINLQREHILPILKKDNVVKEGTSNMIFQVEIHPDHQEDLINNKDRSLAKLAIKEFKVPSYDGELQRDAMEMWTSEIQTLEEVCSLNHPHLQQCLAAITRGTQYYQLVPWADGGNLREFWHDHPKPNVTADLVRNIIGQFRGLADALRSLHGYEGHRHLRHGDIKPENILVFLAQDRDKIGTLKIAGIGSAKHHSMSSRFREPHPRIFYTYIYQPPESVTDKFSARSRRSDLWSMGCVLLESMVWLLYGWKELEGFNASLQGGLEEASHFFTVKEELQVSGIRAVAQVHPAVEACLDGLARDPECGPTTALGDLLRIIRTKLLVVELRRPDQEFTEPSEFFSAIVETPSPMPDQPTGSYRVTASELLSALDGILQGRGAFGERYWFTGQRRENLRLHRSIPKVVMDDNSPYLSPEWTPQHRARGDYLRVRQSTLPDVSLTIPSIHVQEYPVTEHLWQRNSTMSQLPTQRWSPSAVLDIITASNDISCAGITRRGLPCRWDLGGDPKLQARHLLDSMSQRPPLEALDFLPELARLCLCQKAHQRQAARVVAEWTALIEPYARSLEREDTRQPHPPVDLGGNPSSISSGGGVRTLGSSEPKLRTVVMSRWIPKWLQRQSKSPSMADPTASSTANTTASSSTTATSQRKTFPCGIKLLHDSEHSVVDIILIHGLTGDREKTWTAKNAASPWPQSLLPSKVPNARVLTFGYDAYVVDWRGIVSQNRIGNYSMNLLISIATFRDGDDTNNRPIIFICHSLGGLVCEDALSTAARRPERHLRAIIDCTCGILFLSTPHYSAGLAKWAGMLAVMIGILKQTNPQILVVLESDSEVLARVQDEFHTMVRSRNQERPQSIEITCFFEELPLPGVGVVVPKDSAILPGYIPIGIHSNHMDMTKFQREDEPGFTAIAGELRRWIKELTVPSRQ